MAKRPARKDIKMSKHTKKPGKKLCPHCQGLMKEIGHREQNANQNVAPGVRNYFAERITTYQCEKCGHQIEESNLPKFKLPKTQELSPRQFQQLTDGVPLSTVIKQPKRKPRGKKN